MHARDGIHATRQIHAVYPDLPIISFSIHDHVAALMRAAGAVASVGKDVPLHDLFATMRACYAQRGMTQPLPAAA